MEYNDYVRITRNWLRWYRRFKANIKNLEMDIAEQEKVLKNDSTLAAPIAKYGDASSGGYSELNVLERQAAHRIRMEQRLTSMMQDLTEVTRIVDKVNRAVDALDLNDQKIIQAYYMNGKSWGEISDVMHYSEKWARERGAKATREIAFIIFDMRARPNGLKFVFAE